MPESLSDLHTERITILVVDDEPTLRDVLHYALTREGFTVELATDGPSALARARSIKPNLIVLDIMLPGYDGLQVCRAVRAESDVPIIFLSAKGEELDRVLGLELGADDYLTKPFAMRELIARIKALLRRRGAGVPAAAPVSTPGGSRVTIVLGGLTIDEARRSVTLDGAPIALKPKEFELLRFLAAEPGVVFARDTLLRRVWGYDFPVDTRTVDVHVSWLRQKLEPDPSTPRLIETIRGVGYRLNASGAAIDAPGG